MENAMFRFKSDPIKTQRCYAMLGDATQCDAMLTRSRPRRKRRENETKITDAALCHAMPEPMLGIWKHTHKTEKKKTRKTDATGGI